MTKLRALWLAAGLCAGAAPALVAQADLRAIWGSSPTDIWVVGEAPAALHWDGQSWNEMPFGVSRPGTLYGVWASGPRDVFAVGDGGTVLHFDGGSWSRMSVPTDRDVVAVAGRAPNDVYALAQSANDRDAPQLLRYDGKAWAAVPLPLPFRANALALVNGGREVLVAGYAYFDPQPSERRQAGIVARWSGGRWVTSGWDGEKVSDPVVGAAGWTEIVAAGAAVLMFGTRQDGTKAIATSSGGAWTLMPPAASAMSRTQVGKVTFAGDATPVALYAGDGFARFAGGRWTAVTGQASMMQLMGGQQPGATPEQQQQALAQRQQLLAQMQANPMMMALRMQAFDMSNARGVWGTGARDFYVTTSAGRIVHVVNDDATIVYDAACADPASAGTNPLCQALQAKQ